MKIDKNQLNTYFSERLHIENYGNRIRGHIGAAARDYILEILKKADEKKQDHPFMSIEDITSKLKLKEPRFRPEDIDLGLHLLNYNGKAEYVHDGTFLEGMKLIDEKKK